MAKSRKQKKYERHLGVKKYNTILSVLISDKKKSGEKYNIRDLQRQASSIYPNFKDKPFKSINKTKIRTAIPQGLLPGQRHYVKLDIPEQNDLESLLTPRYYFQSVAIPEEIVVLRKDPKIKFVSKISPAGTPPFYSGDNITYEQYFQTFVNYCNKLRDLSEDDDAYNHDWFIRVTPPADYNGELICFIISCDEDGHEVDYGYDPLNPEQEIDEISGEEQAPRQKKSKPGKETEKDVSELDRRLREAEERNRQAELELEKSKERQKEIDLEIQKSVEATSRETTFQMAMKLLMDGKISHDQFDHMIGFKK